MLELTNGTNEFRASVRGTETYQVVLNHQEGEDWESTCSCPVGEDCKHICAVLNALLAENTASSVRRLSARSNPSVPVKRPGSLSFEEEIKAANGRELSRDEKIMARRIETLFQKLGQSAQVTGFHFQELGFTLGTGPWDRLQLWPQPPKSAREFWSYVAFQLVSEGGKIPEFLTGVTDLEAAKQGMAQLRRKEAVKEWKARLEAEAGQTDAEPAELRTVDLRLRFWDTGAALEWNSGLNGEFVALKPGTVRTLQAQLADDQVELTPAAHFIFEVFANEIVNLGRGDVNYRNPEIVRTLGRLFRNPVLEGKLVQADGTPIVRREEKLRWNLQPAADREDDYVLKLTRADGSPAPRIYCELPGRPRFFLTGDGLFPGPSGGGVLDSGSENRIPAPALESAPGILLLRQLEIELPPALQQRVRVVPLKMKVSFELEPSFTGSRREQCVITVLAATAEGDAIESWSGWNWEKIKTLGATSKKEKKLVVHDRSGLVDPRALLLPFNARWDGYREQFSFGATRKLPELLTTWLQQRPPGVEVELKGELASLTEDAVVGRVKLDVVERNIDWFDLSVVLDVDDTTLTPAELKLLLNARGGFVRLEGKGWRRLQFDITGEEDEKLARLGLSPRELSAEPQRLHALQLADTAAKKFLSGEQYERIERRANEIKTRVTPDIPAGVSAQLRPYQLEGFHFLAYLSVNRFGGILADDMGLGKTVQTLAWLEWLRTAPEMSDPVAGSAVKPSLVVCPKSVMDNWRSESARFVPGLRVKVWAAHEFNSIQLRLHEFDLHVLNYSQLRSLSGVLATIQWLAVILDEGQYIKNPASLTAMIARGLRAGHRLILSGTPIENRLLDLWSLMAYAMPGVLGNKAHFARLYDAKEDPMARRRLSARVRPFLLRRTKGQVAKDLPDRVEEDLLCEMEGEQLMLYRAELKRAQQMLLAIKTQKQLAQERFHFLTSLLRLRQICCHPRLVKPDSHAVSAKLEALLEQLEPLMDEGHKVLVFSQFVEMLDILRVEIERKGWPQFYLSGQTENRGELVEKFQGTEGAGVFLISLKAGGFGLNLTAASYVVLFDPWWNPAVENQAIDRTHRIGQTRNVNAYRLLIKGSIEEKIRVLQKKKSSLAEDVLGEEKFAQSLTLDDLHFLLSDDPA